LFCNKKIFFIFILSIYSCIILAQKDTVLKYEPSVKFDKKYLKSYFTDTKNVVISPLHWNKKQWITFTAIAGTNVFIYSQDDKIQDFFQNNRTKSLDNISKYAFKHWGDGTYSMSAIGLLYIYGTLSKNNQHKEAALLGTKAFVTSAVFTYLIKYSFHRHRPDDDKFPNPYIWEGPCLKSSYTSFISGHTTSIFSVASVIASEYKDKKAIPVIAYSIAGLTAISRIYDNKHWATDVIAGAALGYAIGKLIYNNRIQIYPYSSFNSNGISMIIFIDKK